MASTGLKVWKKAVRLIEEGNVRQEYRNEVRAKYIVVGDTDAYPVHVDLDTHRARCECPDTNHGMKLTTCSHELAAHLALSLEASGNESNFLEDVFESADLLLREGKKSLID